MTAPTNKPVSPEDFERFTHYYHHCSVPGEWGNLHIVLADGNVKDSHVQFCINQAAEAKDGEGVYLGNVLLGMSKSQRLKLADKIGNPF